MAKSGKKLSFVLFDDFYKKRREEDISAAHLLIQRLQSAIKEESFSEQLIKDMEQFVRRIQTSELEKSGVRTLLLFNGEQ